MIFKKEIFVCKETKPVISPSIDLPVLSQQIFFNTTPLNAKAVFFVLFCFTPVKQLILNYYNLLALMYESRYILYFVFLIIFGLQSFTAWM